MAEAPASLQEELARCVCLAQYLALYLDLDGSVPSQADRVGQKMCKYLQWKSPALSMEAACLDWNCRGQLSLDIGQSKEEAQRNEERSDCPDGDAWCLDRRISC